MLIFVLKWRIVKKYFAYVMANGTYNFIVSLDSWFCTTSVEYLVDDTASMQSGFEFKREDCHLLITHVLWFKKLLNIKKCSCYTFYRQLMITAASCGLCSKNYSYFCTFIYCIVCTLKIVLKCECSCCTKYVIFVKSVSMKVMIFII